MIRELPISIRVIAATVGAIVVAAGCARITALAEYKPPAEISEGSALLKAGDRESAIAKFNAAVSSAPRDPRVYARIMGGCARAGDRELVDRYYREALEATRSLSSEQQSSVHYHAGTAYLYLRDFERAIQATTKSYELTPDSYDSLNGLGYSYAEAGRELPKAVELITRAIELARKQEIKPEALGLIIDSLGWAYYKQRRYDDALKALSEAVSLTPSLGEIQFHLGLAYEAKNRLNEARVAFSRATVLDPEIALYRQALGRVTSQLKSRGELTPPSGAPAHSHSPQPR